MTLSYIWRDRPANRKSPSTVLTAYNSNRTFICNRDRVGIVEESCGYLSRGDQYSGEIRFVEKPGVQEEGGRHVAKRSFDPQVAYPEVKVQIRDLV